MNRLQSTVTCPHCHATETIDFEAGTSQYLYRCPACANILKTKSGDCCILCSYGSLDCSSSEQNLAA
ncbi:GDCCVxC domain-containing (seleno)protein [Polynucleobacter sp. UK-Kesae-W10]|uniref:GDCCVxC domain-containing (seleno)protein n=1 Tax=Polynucleobacter sp. UK-Kesae-W10 TaxID=1819738 RepID=UPI00351D704A